MIFMVAKSSAVRTFKKWLTLGPKNGRTFGLCTTWENRFTSGVTAIGSCT
jgi:hypothetical protein